MLYCAGHPPYTYCRSKENDRRTSVKQFNRPVGDLPWKFRRVRHELLQGSRWRSVALYSPLDQMTQAYVSEFFLQTKQFIHGPSQERVVVIEIGSPHQDPDDRQDDEDRKDKAPMR